VNTVSSESTQPGSAPSRRTLVWVNTTYFAEGLPYMVVRILSSLYFTQLGVRELYLGYLNYLGLPWNLKFLWAPLVDGWGSKRVWQICTQVVLGLLTFCIAYLSYCAGSSQDPQEYLSWIAGIFIIMAFVAATNDIAIDGFYLEAIPAREQQALLSGYRVLAYRLAMVFARSGLVALVAYSAAGFAQGSPALAWIPAFSLAGVVLVGLAWLHIVILPQLATPKVRKDTHGDRHRAGALSRAFRVFKDGFTTYLNQPRIAIILLFIILYKLGDEVLFSMVTPFLMRELKITTQQYAWLAGIVGAAGTIIGAMCGGWWIKKVGLRKALWPLSVLMNVNIWLYVWLSYTKPDPTTFGGISSIAFVHAIEQIAAGLGSAALLVFLLTTCSKEFRATHYAIGSAIMSIPGTVIGGEAGRIVEAIGYTNLYILAFVLAIPGMCLIPFVPIREES
jgi:PAT family beta-lactamase induction signal transducer AmpG